MHAHTQHIRDEVDELREQNARQIEAYKDTNAEYEQGLVAEHNGAVPSALSDTV